MGEGKLKVSRTPPCHMLQKWSAKTSAINGGVDKKVLNSPLGPAQRWVRNAGKPPEKSHVAEVGSVTAFWKEKLEAMVRIVEDRDS
jgi:hypothetical protein